MNDGEVVVMSAELPRCANPECGLPFVPAHGNQIYCKKACSKQVLNRRYQSAHKGQLLAAKRKKYREQRNGAATRPIGRPRQAATT